jgi:hypothetical protein
MTYISSLKVGWESYQVMLSGNIKKHIDYILIALREYDETLLELKSLSEQVKLRMEVLLDKIEECETETQFPASINDRGELRGLLLNLDGCCVKLSQKKEHYNNLVSMCPIFGKKYCPDMDSNYIW